MCTQREVEKRASIDQLFKHRYLAEVSAVVQAKQTAGQTGTTTTGTGTGTGTGPQPSDTSNKDDEKNRLKTQDSVEKKVAK
ncbi:hypothetical protein COOONC_13050 [Cooperia oncophora]